MKIAIGNDHVGLELKPAICEFVESKGHKVVDYGTNQSERTDYPIYGIRVAQAVASGVCDLGIVICGTGAGISIAANKVEGIRAACVSEPYTAKLSREHNDSNILAFGARVVGVELAKMIVEAWLDAKYEGGRHAKRVKEISDFESGCWNPTEEDFHLS